MFELIAEKLMALNIEYENGTGKYKMTKDDAKMMMSKVYNINDEDTLRKLYQKLAAIYFFNTVDTTITHDDKTQHGIV